MNTHINKISRTFKNGGFLKMVKKDQGVGLLDLVLLIVALLLIFTQAKIFFFHIIFVTLTFGAFYWKFRPFVIRALFWVMLVTTVILIATLDDAIPAEELIEIPLLTTILVLVFVIARQRAKAEQALRQTNEELECRVEERTVELTRVNSELTQAIAQYKQTERTRRKLSSVVEQTADIVIITNKEGVIEYVNPAFEKELGYTLEEVRDQTPRILKSNQHAPEFYEQLWETILLGEVYRGVFINKKKNGKLYFEEKIITPLRNSNENITHFVSTGRDITERKQAEEALRESEERYRRLVELSFEAIIIHSAGKIVHVNTPGVELLGASGPGSLIGKSVLDFVHSDYLKTVQARVDQLQNEAKGVPLIEEKFIRLDRTTVDVEVTAVPITFRGQPAIQTVARDITTRKQAEKEREQLLTTEHEQRLLAETLGEVFLALTAHISREGVLDEILRQARRLVSYSAANIVLLKRDTLHIARHHGYDTYNNQKMISKLEQPLAQFPLDAEVVQSYQSIIVPDTSQNPQWVTVPEMGWIRSFIAVPICVRKQVLGLLRFDGNTPGKFSLQDVERLQPLANAAAIALENARLYDQAQQELAERRQVEKELRQIAAKNQAILDAIPDSIFQFSRTGRLLDYRVHSNHPAQGILGDVAIGNHLSDILPPNLVELTLQHIGKVLDTNEMQIIEFQLPMAPGVREFETRLVANGPNEVLGIISDITERKARAAAIERERVRIARDLHDSLGQSLGYLHLKLDELSMNDVPQKKGEMLQQELSQMCGVANEAYEMVRSMLAAARPTNSIDLGTALLAEAKSVGNRAGFKVQLSSEGQSFSLSPVIQQQILYIFREALSNVEKHAKAKQVNINVAWTTDTLSIAFFDDGCGFDTSSPQPAGHYGLTIMEGRAEDINGLLSIASNPGTGTEVNLLFPKDTLAVTTIFSDNELNRDV